MSMILTPAFLAQLERLIADEVDRQVSRRTDHGTSRQISDVLHGLAHVLGGTETERAELVGGPRRRSGQLVVEARSFTASYLAKHGRLPGVRPYMRFLQVGHHKAAQIRNQMSQEFSPRGSFDLDSEKEATL